MILVIHPYSDPDPAVRSERVARAALYVDRLRAEGRKALATCVCTHGMEGVPTSWEAWWRLNRALVEAADEVHVLRLPGWHESGGVVSEIAHARAIGRTVVEVTPDA